MIASLIWCNRSLKRPQEHTRPCMYIGLQSPPACCSKEPCNQATNRAYNPMLWSPTRNPMHQVDRHPQAKRSSTRGQSRAGDRQCPFKLLGRPLFSECASHSAGRASKLSSGTMKVLPGRPRCCLSFRGKLGPPRQVVNASLSCSIAAFRPSASAIQRKGGPSWGQGWAESGQTLGDKYYAEPLLLNMLIG